ncbi:MAG: ABC transporter permease [Thermoleophilia bacterium]|nr:ABC transporter permease [Thermoleophilia bacterium]
MRRTWHIVGKELLQNLRDPLALVFTIVMPLVFTVFLGFIIPGGDDEESALPLAMANLDHGPVATQLIERLDATPLLEIEAMDAAEIDSAVQDQKVTAGLIIPAGYSEAAETGRSIALTFVRLQTSTGAQSVWQAIEAVLSESNAVALAAEAAAEQVATATGSVLNDGLVESARSLVQVELFTPAVVVTTTSGGTSIAAQSGGFEQSSKGSIVYWVFFGVMSVGVTMVLERQRGLLRRLNVAGVRAREIIGGKMITMFIVTFLQQLLLVVVGHFVFGIDYFNNPAALLLVMISLSLLAAAFGLLIASVFRTENGFVATNVITALLLGALGGAWFPLEITSAGFAKVAHVLPSAWLMDSLHGITLKDWGIMEVLGPMGVVWTWIVVLFAAALWRYRPD